LKSSTNSSPGSSVHPVWISWIRSVRVSRINEGVPLVPPRDEGEEAEDEDEAGEDTTRGVDETMEGDAGDDEGETGKANDELGRGFAGTRTGLGEEDGDEDDA
jgi:hypothetical protein